MSDNSAITTSLLELSVDQLKQAVEAAGHPSYRAAQLADWVYRKGVTDPGVMSNLPASLSGQFAILTSRVVRRLDSRDGTIKLLLEFDDHECVECVLIPALQRATACLSTQVGCAMGCKFCASGLDGMKRNLTSGEILQQILHLQQALGGRVTHVVFMGTGEPLANYDNTLGALRAIVDPERFNISARHVTISTVGLPAGIRRLAREQVPVTLAISLHAPNDALRKELIPTAGKFPLSEILSAAKEFFDTRHREITLEYTLLKGVNDGNVCAEALARIAHQLRCNVNLIQYNPIPSLPYRAPGQAAVRAFAQRLDKRGVNVNIRRARGLDAQAACGQLRRVHEPPADEPPAPPEEQA